MLRRLSTSAVAVFGLVLASCGGQPEVDTTPTSAPPQTTVAVTASDEPESTTPQVRLLGEVEEEPSSQGLALSPLAEDVKELPSALPERVLDGLGDPIGRPPTTLSLPDLGVEGATIIPAGLANNGEFEVPGATEVGWYRFGAGVDGGQGSAVLAAHIAYNGRDGVFRNLADSEVGDEIEVGVGDSALRYRVESIDQFEKQALPITELFDESGDERLVLITCGGSFNPALRSYDDNVVVVAVPV